jgi:hypothetical protein
LVGGWHEPQVCSYRAALLEAVGVLQGEDEGKRRKRPYPFDLAQELRFWVVLPRDRLQLAIVLADALCERAYLCSRMGSRAAKSASGMCSLRLSYGSSWQGTWAGDDRRT